MQSLKTANKIPKFQAIQLALLSAILSVAVIVGAGLSIYALNSFFRSHNMESMTTTPGINNAYLYEYSIFCVVLASLTAVIWKKIVLRESKKNHLVIDKNVFFWEDTRTDIITYAKYCLIIVVTSFLFMIANPTLFSLSEITIWQRKLIMETMTSDDAFYQFLQTTIFLAPLWEEIVFRGMLFSGLLLIFPGRYVVLITAALWSLSHYQQYNPIILLEIFIIGLILGYARFSTKSIKVPLIIHITNNMVAVAYMYYCGYSQ